MPKHGVAGTAEHGTLHMYKNKGCRCDPCKLAVSEHNKVYLANKRRGLSHDDTIDTILELLHA